MEHVIVDIWVADRHENAIYEQLSRDMFIRLMSTFDSLAGRLIPIERCPVYEA